MTSDEQSSGWRKGSRFDVARFEKEHAARSVADGQLSLGTPIFYSETTGSTNDDAKRAARDGAPSGSLFLSDAQTQGKGRQGKRWLSSPGEALTFSLLLESEGSLEEASHLPLVVGLALLETLARLELTPRLGIKWPNDIVTRPALGTERPLKLAGILSEAVQLGAQYRFVVGVGLNVATQHFPDEIAGIATSVRALAPELTLPRKEALLLDFLGYLQAKFHIFRNSGISALSAELNQGDALLGRTIEVDGRPGVARGIDTSGALLLEQGDLVRATRSGTVEFG